MCQVLSMRSLAALVSHLYSKTYADLEKLSEEVHQYVVAIIWGLLGKSGNKNRCLYEVLLLRSCEQL